jgi:hypothetical protein
MTNEELQALRNEIEELSTALRKMATGERVSEVRFRDRMIKYSEITLPELREERDRLISMLPQPVSRLRPMKYVGM